MPAGEAVGTAFVFAGVLRLIAAPFYLFRRNVNSRYFRLMLTAPCRDLILGIIALRAFAHAGNSPYVVIILGLLLTVTAAFEFCSEGSKSEFRRQEFTLAAVACFPDRNRVWVFFRRRWRVWGQCCSSIIPKCRPRKS